MARVITEKNFTRLGLVKKVPLGKQLFMYHHIKLEPFDLFSTNTKKDIAIIPM